MEPEVTTEVTKVEEPTKVGETKVEEIKVEETKVESPDQQAALNLFNALKNPETSGIVIKQLAELAGLEIGVKKDQVTLKKTISQIITEELGEDNSILAEKLGPALERVIAKAVEDQVKPIQDTISEQKKNEFATRIDKTFESLNTESKGLSKKLESRMVELMDQIQPGPKTEPEAYIRHIFTLAKSDFDEAERIKTQDVKRDQNKKTTNVPIGVNTERVKSGSKLPTIREAVLAASRGETLE
jgi:hypothetical protein